MLHYVKLCRQKKSCILPAGTFVMNAVVSSSAWPVFIYPLGHKNAHIRMLNHAKDDYPTWNMSLSSIITPTEVRSLQCVMTLQCVFTIQ